MDAWKLGELTEAIELFESALSADPGDWVPKSDYGRLLVMMTDYEKAGPLLEQSAELNPDSARVWLDLYSYYQRNMQLERGFHVYARAEELAQSGLDRVNISIDTMDPEAFKRITRGGDLARVLAGVDAARAAGLTPIKINCVIVDGENEDQVDEILEKTKAPGGDGKREPYKTTRYGSSYHFKQHGE